MMNLMKVKLQDKNYIIVFLASILVSYIKENLENPFFKNKTLMIENIVRIILV